ncbi:MAG: hypothetical protein II744_05665 [Eubacterium sp.]|nr:hypothetical protein [Eubacterium sp.]
MLKGINKQILEVTNTESPYFERIVFFVRPDKNTVSEACLKKEAESISSKIKRPPRPKKTARQWVKTAVYITLGAGAGAAITFLMGYIA